MRSLNQERLTLVDEHQFVATRYENRDRLFLAMKLLPPAPKWDRAVDGLQDGWAWASDFERSSLPPDFMFPKAGQTWEAIRDCEVNFIAFIPRTILPSGGARLRQGERVRVITGEPKPIRVAFQPVRYHELHALIVPEEVRKRPNYQYYYLTLRVARTPGCFLCKEPGFFNELFHLVEDVA